MCVFMENHNLPFGGKHRVLQGNRQTEPLYTINVRSPGEKKQTKNRLFERATLMLWAKSGAAACEVQFR